MYVKRNIVGKWERGGNDGSNIGAMVYNYGVTFHKDRTGGHLLRRKKMMSILMEEEAFLWDWLGMGEIRVKSVEKENEE